MLKLKFQFLFILHMLSVIFAIIDDDCDCDCDSLLVHTKSGVIKGVKERSFFKDQLYLSFKGIPYAKPPVGELRFKAPEPIEPWSDIYETTHQYRNICLILDQSRLWSRTPAVQSEDCLYLNVFTPVLGKNKTNAKLPVMVWIHGGAFTEGDGTDALYGPDMMMENNVILVTLDYRLGPFGFANFELPGYTGNMGLKDQQVALEWINRNIEYFGGDPTSITIIGESVGGASVHLQVLSRKSRKYFHQAIAMSGTAFNYWATADSNNQLELLYETFKNELHGHRNSTVVLNFMKNAPVELILQKTPAYRILEGKNLLYWAAVIEDPTKAIRPFLTKTPRQIYRTTNIDVPILFGDVTAESMFFLNETDPYAWVDSMSANFNLSLPFNGLTLTPDSLEYDAIINEIREFYFGSDVITKTPENLNKYVQMMSDMNFVYWNYAAMKLHATKANTFCYKFDLDLNLNYLKMNSSLSVVDGMGHAEDLLYLFRAKKLSHLYDEVLANLSDGRNRKTLNAIQFASKLFVDFAKNGIPWDVKPLRTGKTTRCVHITNDGLKVVYNARCKAMKLWRRIHTRLQPWLPERFF